VDDCPAFGVREHTLDGVTVVEISGELDLFTAARISGRLAALACSECPDLVLDLRPVAFLDCAGLSLLCRLRNRVLARGGRLRLVIRDERLLRLLRLVRLDDAFEVVPDLAAVLACPGRPRAGENNGAIA
jgi:anti-sigma B factor antagonist